MNIQQMQYYAEVCRHENVTRAAEALHISQSTLSLAMKNIEQETGLNLFRHVGRNIQLTEDGHTLLHKVEDMLKQVKRFEGSVREIRACPNVALSSSKRDVKSIAGNVCLSTSSDKNL